MKPANRKKPPLISVYTVCHNYGRYLDHAVESVLSQSFEDWELLIFDDGSTDDTQEVINRYAHYPKVRIFIQKQQGLIKTCNQAIEAARGKYIMRLDADDYLDENALLILAQTLKNQPDLALAYPDYFIINDENVILEHVRNHKISSEFEVLDLPAHGACSLIKKSVLLEVNKYDDANQCQDGYDLWLKLIGKNYKIKNVNLPLFFYRTHDRNLTRQVHKILDSRQKIKERYVRGNMNPEKYPEVLAIIPTRGIKANPFANPLIELNGERLIDYTLRAASEAERVSRRIVISEDEEVLNYVRENFACDLLRRPEKLGELTSPIEDTVLWVLRELKAKDNYEPEWVMVLYVTAPLRKAAHIDEAIYSQMIFKTDSVISVTLNTKFLYRHNSKGMRPLYKKRLLRYEKDSLYEENGAIMMSRISAITAHNFLGKTIGHVLMSCQDSLQIISEFDFWMVEQVIKDRANRKALTH